VSVVPEFDFPGHCYSAVEAMKYRERTTGDISYRLVDPADTSKYLSLQGYPGNVIDIALPSTFTFIGKVFDSVVSMYAEAGVPLSEIGKVIEEVVTPHGFSISRDFVGHGIGKVMHDEPQIYHFYDKRWDKVKMVPGLVFTIEPMINTGSPECKIDDDGWTARTVDGGMSAQWEHTIGITEDGAIIFTEKMI
jgi:methionyl aminopeptidase